MGLPFKNYDMKSPDRDVYSLYGKIAIGSSGAPTLSYGKGVDAVTKLATGIYQITTHAMAVKCLSARIWPAASDFVTGTVGTGSGATALVAPLGGLIGYQLFDASMYKSFGCVTMATAIATNYLQINGVTFTGVAYNASPTDSGTTWQWQVGQSNAEAAYKLASTINACTHARINGIVDAVAYGALMFVFSNQPVIAWACTATTLTKSHATTLQQGSAVVVGLYDDEDADTEVEPTSGSALLYRLDMAGSNYGF